MVGDEPGLIMIQVDGLSREEFNRAIDEGRLPFLARLIRRKHFTLESFYSGVPSTTPAVQGEIFFGVRTAVPAFEFLDRKSGKVFRMYESTAAASIQSELEKKCVEPLLRGGHAYLDIYRAGADDSRYCSQDTALREVLRRQHPLKWVLLVFIYAPRIGRVVALFLLECLLAIFDAMKGIYEQGKLYHELAFIPARVFFSIVLRELVRFRVMLDVEMGVQVIHANFLGYDEQAHRRGPSSIFAHWTLKGIDRALRDICRVAERSNRRDYEWIVYSDHGQESTTAFEVLHGRTVAHAVKEVFGRGPLEHRELWESRMSEVVARSIDSCRQYLGMKQKRRDQVAAPDPTSQIVLTAMGPVGHLYLPDKLTGKEMDRYAKDLVKIAGIPLVLTTKFDGEVQAYNAQGVWDLQSDSKEVIGNDHPFPDEASEDLGALCRHPDAGDFVISGWNPRSAPVSFAMESGGHGGPGRRETEGFLLIPDRIYRWHMAHPPATRLRVRGVDLHDVARHFLGRDGKRDERVPEHPVRNENLTFRVMTYNIHSCRGIDGKIRPERIARVMNQFDPDIIAVQELDVHRARSGMLDQSQVIADHLRMDHVFHAVFEEEHECYGIAIFSKYPLKVVKADHLTGAKRMILREARGAIWVRIELEGCLPLNLINTHFGLGRREKRLQVEHLLGSKWLGGIPEDEPVILCGDFNSGPRSTVFKRLSQRLVDVQQVAVGQKPRPTFSSVRPMMRIDHMFVSRHFRVEAVDRPDTLTAVMASDHLPVCAEVCLVVPE